MVSFEQISKFISLVEKFVRTKTKLYWCEILDSNSNMVFEFKIQSLDLFSIDDIINIGNKKYTIIKIEKHLELPTDDYEGTILQLYVNEINEEIDNPYEGEPETLVTTYINGKEVKNPYDKIVITKSCKIMKRK